MKPTTIHAAISAFILIALLCSAGCSFLPAGETAAPAGSATPSVTAPVVKTTVAKTPMVTTRLPTVRATAAISAVPTAVIAASGTTGTQAEVAGSTPVPEETIAEESTVESTVAETEVVTPEVTETQPGEDVPVTEEPTPVPTIVSVPYSCSYIGGNFCTAGETCSGALIRTTDEDLCCAGVCES